MVLQAPSGNLPKPSLILPPAATLSLSTLGVGPEAPDAGTVPLDVATSTSTAPVPAATATKAQATGNAQTTAPSTSKASFAPMPKSVQKEAIQDRGLLAQAAQTETAPRADSLPSAKATRTTAAATEASGLQIRASAQAAQLATNPGPQSNPVATAVPVSVKAPVNATQAPRASGSGIRTFAPQTPSVKAPVNNSSAMASNFSATQPPQASGARVSPSAPQTPSVKAPVNHSSATASNFIATQAPQASGASSSSIRAGNAKRQGAGQS